MSIITRRQNDFGYLKEMRRRFGNSTIDADGRVRDIYRSLQSGEIVALLPDQAAPESDLHAELFGINAPVHSSPARLAQLFGPIVIVGFATSRPRGRYRVELHELDYDDLKQGEFDRHEFMQRYYNLLEQHLRSHPSDWVWHHRRWKNIQGLYDASS